MPVVAADALASDVVVADHLRSAIATVVCSSAREVAVRVTLVPSSARAAVTSSAEVARALITLGAKPLIAACAGAVRREANSRKRVVAAVSGDAA